MNLPYGEIKDKILQIKFSTADFSIASVLNAIKVHLDVIEEMGVVFLGAQTEIVAGPSPVFQPVPVIAQFEFRAKWGQISTCYMRFLSSSYANCYVECRDLTPIISRCDDRQT
jgi:hypothetical protein